MASDIGKICQSDLRQRLRSAEKMATKYNLLYLRKCDELREAREKVFIYRQNYRLKCDELREARRQKPASKKKSAPKKQANIIKGWQV